MEIGNIILSLFEWLNCKNYKVSYKNKNNEKEFNILSNKVYYKVIMVKVIEYWYRNRLMDKIVFRNRFI